MTITTSRLALQRPETPDPVSELRTAIGANAATLDAAATYLEGTLVARPAASLRGRVYRATDTGQVFLDTGAAWLTLTQYVEGTAAARPAAGSAGRLYRATDSGLVSLDTGGAWLDLPVVHAARHAIGGADPLTPAAIGAQPVIAVVTSLPAAPADGQECIFVADATNGVAWHLKYRAASASAYKWEVIGGSWLSAEVVTGEARSATTYADLTTIGPDRKSVV